MVMSVVLFGATPFMSTEPVPSTSCGRSTARRVHAWVPLFVSSTSAIRLPAAPPHGLVIRAARLPAAHGPGPCGRDGSAVGVAVGAVVGAAVGVGTGVGVGVGTLVGVAVAVGVSVGPGDPMVPMPPFEPGRPTQTATRRTAARRTPAPAMLALEATRTPTRF